MIGPAAISADFATFKPVPSRKVLQIILEVPEERTKEVFAALGIPMSGASLPVAVARLVDAKEEPDKAPVEQKQPRRFDSLPLPQQAALLCADEGFWRWLRQGSILCTSQEDAADWLRRELGVSSRADITLGTKAAETFFRIRDRYQLWQMGISA